MTQKPSESPSTYSAVQVKKLKLGKINVEALLLTPPESHKIYPPNNNLIEKCYLKLYSATMNVNFSLCKKKKASNLSL